MRVELGEAEVAELLQRLAERITVQDDGCWTCGIDEYPEIRVGSVRVLVHRLMWALVNGPIPAELVIDHDCHNRDPQCPGGPTCRHRRCCRPDHLRAVSDVQNRAAGRHGARTLPHDDGWIATVDLARRLGRIPAGADAATVQRAVARVGLELWHGHRLRSVELPRSVDPRRVRGYRLVDVAPLLVTTP